MPLCAPTIAAVSGHASDGGLSRAPCHCTDLVIDQSGWKVFGEGEWKGSENTALRNGESGARLHLAVDPATHDIVAAEVSAGNVHDAEALPTLLNPLRRKLGRVYADALPGDSKASHSAYLAQRGDSLYPASARTRGYGKRDTQEMRLCW